MNANSRQWKIAPRALAALLCIVSAVSALSAGTTDLATQRLLDIAATEEKIYKRIAEDPEFYTAADLDRRGNELVQAYRAYLGDHPNDVSALILYGKLLRRMDQNEQAFTVFLKADELDPEIAVVKQQIGTHLAEKGKGKSALTFYLQAIELEPETAVYHFALGQLLSEFRDEFTEEAMFTPDALDREMLKAFRKAAQLTPDNYEFQMRLGEAYYDLASPDWKRALLHWEKLYKDPDTQLDSLRKEIVNLHIARVLGKLGRAEEARELLDTIEQRGLQYSRQQVLDELNQH